MLSSLSPKFLISLIAWFISWLSIELSSGGIFGSISAGVSSTIGVLLSIGVSSSSMVSTEIGLNSDGFSSSIGVVGMLNEFISNVTDAFEKYEFLVAILVKF